MQGVILYEKYFQNSDFNFSWVSVASCELFSPSRWEEYNQSREERGRTCYEKYNGNVYCEDTK